MRKSSIVLIGWMLIFGGCSQNAHVSSSIELMNAERRALEDQLYDLEYQYESAVDQLDDLQAENQALREQLGGKAPRRPPARGGSRAVAPRDATESDDPDLSPPSIDGGELSIPRIEIPDIDDGTSLEPPGQIAISVRDPQTEPLDPRITRLRINSRRTRAVDLNTNPGDDGLEIVLEPLNDAGKIVVLPAPITIVLLDYALRDQGDRARVARWDLSAADVARFIQDTPDGDGIRLQLLWPERPPEHIRLRMDVRYETLDGRQLDARSDVRVRLDSRFSSRWTPRANSNRSGNPTQQASSAPAVPPADSAAEEPAAEEPADDDNSSTPTVARPEWQPYR